MEHSIQVWECVSPADRERFWQELNAYFARDIGWQPPPDYRADVERLCARQTDPVRCLFFARDGQTVGFALTVVYAAEDGKQFILEFCVLPPCRGGGTGAACAAALLAWGRAHGAQFAELNCDTPRRQRFWARQGFVPNGCDQWAVPLMLLPPAQRLPFTVRQEPGPEEIWGLEESFRAAVGEPPLTDAQRARLAQAVQDGRIVFFTARRQNRPVGICSVSLHWSSYACTSAAVFEDFYVEPAFRGQGAARLLAGAARAWCAAQGCASITVGCAACDAAMYRSLGFEQPLGTLLAMELGN